VFYLEDFESLREKMLKKAREGISQAYANEEYALIQVINAYDETDKSYNLAYERLSEWFGLYFPEISVNNSRTLAKLVNLLIGKEYTYESILNIVNDENTAKFIYEKARNTIGRKASSNESAAILKFAELAESFSETLTALEDYIKVVTEQIMPNTTYLTEPRIAAELLSKAGSLERLATMPAGTIQLLGAEGALFKHLKFGSKPPKYGILFKLPDVGTAPKELKGAIARIYATKLSIALKADYYTKNFIAKALKQNIEKSIENLKNKPRKQKKENQNTQYNHKNRFMKYKEHKKDRKGSNKNNFSSRYNKNKKYR
jgi:nucleolar protein 56